MSGLPEICESLPSLAASVAAGVTSRHRPRRWARRRTGVRNRPRHARARSIASNPIRCSPPGEPMRRPSRRSMRRCCTTTIRERLVQSRAAVSTARHVGRKPPPTRRTDRAATCHRRPTSNWPTAVPTTVCLGLARIVDDEMPSYGVALTPNGRRPRRARSAFAQRRRRRSSPAAKRRRLVIDLRTVLPRQDQRIVEQIARSERPKSQRRSRVGELRLNRPAVARVASGRTSLAAAGTGRYETAIETARPPSRSRSATAPFWNRHSRPTLQLFTRPLPHGDEFERQAT